MFTNRIANSHPRRQHKIPACGWRHELLAVPESLVWSVNFACLLVNCGYKLNMSYLVPDSLTTIHDQVCNLGLARLIIARSCLYLSHLMPHGSPGCFLSLIDNIMISSPRSLTLFDYLMLILKYYVFTDRVSIHLQLLFFGSC